MLVWRYILAIGIGATFLACRHPVEPAREAAAVPHPSFALGESERHALVERALSIQQGDLRQSVVQKLGVPTSEKNLARMEDPHVFGSLLRYDVERWEAGLVNESFDQYVEVHLEPPDHVKSVWIRVELQPSPQPPEATRWINPRVSPLPASAFTGVSTSLSLGEVIARLGPAQSDVGSGVYVLEWPVSDGRMFYISTAHLREQERPLFVGFSRP
jgi:hypothetical protein